MRIWDRSPDPRVRPRTGTVKRRGTAQQRTSDPALHPSPHSVPYGTRPILVFLWRIGKKAAGWPDPSPVLGSGPSRTDPQSSGHRICWTRDAHDEGDSPGRRLPD
jgi:hypothetical protein